MVISLLTELDGVNSESLAMNIWFLTKPEALGHNRPTMIQPSTFRTRVVSFSKTNASVL